jgi:hypothetical protein
MPSSHGAELEHRDSFTFTFLLLLEDIVSEAIPFNKCHMNMG